jgi:hypothetical protein
MMKKVWLVLLAVVLVLGLALLGCKSGGGKDDDDDDLIEKIVFDLETDEGIQALAVGVLSFADNANPIKPLVRAGGDDAVKIEAVDNAGKKAIKFSTIKDWGAGIDLRQASGDGGTGFAFRAGDKIKIAGEFVSGAGRLQVNRKVGAEYVTIGGVDTEKKDNGPFEMEFTLTAEDVAALKSGGPAGLRIEGRPDNIVAQINTLIVTGMRPSNAKPLPAPVLTAEAENIVTWSEIDGAGGYKIFVAPDGGEFEEAASLGPAATSFSLLDKSSLAEGKYQVKAIALGIEGSSKDSPESNVVTLNKVIPAQIVLWESGAWKTGYTSTTVTNDGGNTKISFATPIDTTSLTRVYIKLNSTPNYKGGSVEGNDTMTGSAWVNNQYWSGFGKVEPNASGETDTFYGEFTKGDDTVGAFKQLVIGGEDQLSTGAVIKIWLE